MDLKKRSVRLLQTNNKQQHSDCLILILQYIGPTSLDHSLALILANLAGVRQGNLVLDPFVGTASILVACSYFGAFCTGMDIDARYRLHKRS